MSRSKACFDYAMARKGRMKSNTISPKVGQQLRLLRSNVGTKVEFFFGSIVEQIKPKYEYFETVGKILERHPKCQPFSSKVKVSKNVFIGKRTFLIVSD